MNQIFIFSLFFISFDTPSKFLKLLTLNPQVSVVMSSQIAKNQALRGMRHSTSSLWTICESKYPEGRWAVNEA